MSEDVIKKHKKLVQKYDEASEDIRRIADSPDRFLVLSREDTRWKQAQEKLKSAISELNELLDSDDGDETTAASDVKNIGF